MDAAAEDEDEDEKARHRSTEAAYVNRSCHWRFFWIQERMHSYKQ